MIKAWTEGRADSRNRYFWIRRILYKWKNPDLQVLWMCSWRFKLESYHIPKFLATLTGGTSMFPTVTLSIFTLESCCFVPINIKFELIRKHPRRNVRYAAFHGNDRISLIGSRVRTKRPVKLGVISIGMCLK